MPINLQDYMTDTEEMVFQVIEDYLVEREILEKKHIDYKTTLNDTGMDSLDVLEFVMEIEDRTGLLTDNFLIESWTRKTTLGEICKTIALG